MQLHDSGHGWQLDVEGLILAQVSRMLPWSSKGTLSFQVYLKVVKWFENLEEVEKLKGCCDMMCLCRALCSMLTLFLTSQSFIWSSIEDRL